MRVFRFFPVWCFFFVSFCSLPRKFDYAFIFVFEPDNRLTNVYTTGNWRKKREIECEEKIEKESERENILEMRTVIL